MAWPKKAKDKPKVIDEVGEHHLLRTAGHNDRIIVECSCRNGWSYQPRPQDFNTLLPEAREKAIQEVFLKHVQAARDRQRG
jgi:hypothetical protein